MATKYENIIIKIMQCVTVTYVEEKNVLLVKLILSVCDSDIRRGKKCFACKINTISCTLPNLYLSEPLNTVKIRAQIYDGFNQLNSLIIRVDRA